ncbi:MAG TPA: SGNH/GDSL hydrolase family protein [Capsulimonadaceae bacterium]|jgi:lysophospholipase L1-like esterase
MKVLIFGDSICAGSNVPDGGPGDAWPNLLPAMIPGLEILNRSVGGRPTSAVADFETELWDAGKLDAVVLALGGNDSRDFSGAAVENAVRNIGRMVAMCVAAKVSRVVVVGPYNMNVAHWQAGDDVTRPKRVANLVAIDAAYKVMCAQKGIEYISMYGVVPEDAMIADGVHPDSEGNEPIARHFAHAWAKH